MAHEGNHLTARRRYDGVTVIAKAGSLPDGVCPATFTCKVIPGQGEPVTIEVRSYYPFLAAQQAYRIYKETITPTRS